MGDQIGGFMLAWAVTAALYAREKTGKGQLVDTSLMGSIIALEGLILDAPAMLGKEYPRDSRTDAGNPMYNHYRCRDDKWIAVAHLQPRPVLARLLQSHGNRRPGKDPRFSSMEARGANSKELHRNTRRAICVQNADEWLKQLKQAGCICTPIQSLTEVTQDPQAHANHYMIEVDHPDAGRLRQVGFPWDFRDTPATWRKKAPGLGEHTAEILKNLAIQRNRSPG